ncbi:SpoIIE family protein phosphatase [Streptomyces sp. ISL-10]|uniref:SpoIIE family protein phosphatase n=1 Tax=Streptomyces sp. ISL-10 TaxID=2819172 RepID=UPI001BEAC961|nr:SpoIIE family protein phosphatase [Streptomyces sp. ISL-10]MBT2367405.1 SpoIIE family protein phosphatase [Streptomyces sp. ISL-10]
MSSSGLVPGSGPDRPEDCALLVLDDAGTVLACTGVAAELLGIPAARINGRGVGELLTEPGDWARLRGLAPDDLPRSMRASLRGAGGPAPVQLDLLPLDGTLPARFLLRMTAAGVADRREENEALVGALFSQSGIGLAIHDTELRLMRVNPLPGDLRPGRAGRAGGLGRRIGELLVPEDAAVVEAQLRRVATTGEPLIDFVTSARLARAPERDRTISLSALRLSGAKGAVRGVAVTFTDVTEHERARKHAALVGTAASALGRSLEVSRNAQVLADLLVPAFADLAAVDITEAVLVGEEPGAFATGAPLCRAAAVAADGEWPDELYPSGSVIRVRGYESDRLRLGSAVIVADLDELRPRIADDPDRIRLVLTDRAASYMVVPLQARGHVLGAVSVWRGRDRAPFDAQDAAVAEDIGSRAALAIDNARRYTRERRTAETLQRSLLPRPQLKVTAAETAGIYVPGRTLAGTGGSWFDVITLSSSRVAFVVGHVRGYGLNAAATMGSLRTAVRTLCDLDPPPDELLTHLDDLVVRFAEDEQPGGGEGTVRGASCLYAVYDPVSARCKMASAGHAAPVLARAAGGAARVELPAGPALGREGAPFEPVEVELAPGDLLAFAAGSLSTESGGSGHMAEFLGKEAARGAGRPVPEIGREMLVPFLAEPPDDDAALLLARVAVTREDAVAAWEFPADVKLVAQARAEIARQLTRWGLDDLVFTTELIVSELLTNAIRYAGGPVGVRLIRDHRLVCEVSDPSQTQPHLRRARVTDEGGRGLFLIAQLTHRWGSRYTASGKTLWTEQLLPEGLGQ